MKTIAEINAEARKLGLDYGQYEDLERRGKLEDYIRNKFHEESRRNADNVTVEKSCIGNMHGRAGGGRK